MKTTAQKQNVAAISAEFKTFLKDTSDSFLAPQKTVGLADKGASERELGDAIQAFIEANRYQDREETAGDGNVSLVEVDVFGEFINAETAKRLTHTATRTSKVAVENEELKNQLEEMKAMLAKLQGA